MILNKYKKKQKMTDKEKALEKDFKIWCEITGNLSNEELNRRYKKDYLLQWASNQINTPQSDKMHKINNKNEILNFCIECEKLYDCDNNYDENRLFECEKLKKIRSD